MKRLRRICAALLLLLIFFTATDPAKAQQLYIVESRPLETTIGNDKFKDTMDTWIKLIGRAEKSIDVETFYIIGKKGAPFEKVLNAMTRAAERGVKIRIIVESKFYKRYPGDVRKLAEHKNIEHRVIDFGKYTRGIMHAKFFIIDGHTVFVGSQNFDWRAMHHIHEIGAVVINEKIADTFTKIFNLDWQLASHPESIKNMMRPVNERFISRTNPVDLKYKGDTATVYPAFSPNTLVFKNMSLEEPQVLRLINKAEKSVSIQVMSYSPIPRIKKDGYYAALENALKTAAARGVKVRLIISNWSVGRKKLPYLKSLQMIPGITIKISTVPLYSKGHIPFARVEHCKYMLVDDRWTWIGTGNWERGYFQRSRNASLIIDNKKLNSEMTALFNEDWNSSYTEKMNVMKDYRQPKIR